MAAASTTQPRRVPLPRSHVRWVGAAPVSNVGVAALSVALGWAAAAREPRIRSSFALVVVTLLLGVASSTVGPATTLLGSGLLLAAVAVVAAADPSWRRGTVRDTSPPLR